MAYIDEVLADSPLVYWRLDETSGTTAADASGNARPGAHTGVTVGQPSLLGDGSGKSAAYNSTGYTRISHGAWVNVAQPTVEVRYKPTTASLTGTKVLASVWSTGTGNPQRWILWLNNGKVEAFIYSSGSLSAIGATTLTAGVTYTIAFKYDGSQGLR